MSTRPRYFMQDQVRDRVAGIMRGRPRALDALSPLLPAALTVLAAMTLLQLLLSGA